MMPTFSPRLKNQRIVSQPRRSSKGASSLIVLVALMASITAPLDTLAANQISQFETVRGPIRHFEKEDGKAHLLLQRTGRRVALPAHWKNTNAEQTMSLGSQTAVVVSYSDDGCDARLALLVVTPTVIWGPYQLGQKCDDVLAYQRSEDGTAFVAIRADGSFPAAWVYSALDEKFRGPALIPLPGGLATMANHGLPPPEPSSKPAEAGPTATPDPMHSPPKRATAPPPRPSAPPRPSTPALSPRDAGNVADQIRRTTPSQRRVTIDLT